MTSQGAHRLTTIGIWASPTWSYVSRIQHKALCHGLKGANAWFYRLRMLESIHKFVTCLSIQRQTCATGYMSNPLNLYYKKPKYVNDHSTMRSKMVVKPNLFQDDPNLTPCCEFSTFITEQGMYNRTA